MPCHLILLDFVILYLISSHRQPTGGDPSAWGFDVELTTTRGKKNCYEMLHRTSEAIILRNFTVSYFELYFETFIWSLHFVNWTKTKVSTAQSVRWREYWRIQSPLWYTFVIICITSFALHRNSPGINISESPAQTLNLLLVLNLARYLIFILPVINVNV
jgi:hypothetical protein